MSVLASARACVCECVCARACMCLCVYERACVCIAGDNGDVGGNSNDGSVLC